MGQTSKELHRTHRVLLQSMEDESITEECFLVSTGEWLILPRRVTLTLEDPGIRIRAILAPVPEEPDQTTAREAFLAQTTIGGR